MNLTKLALKRPVAVCILLSALLIFGGSSLFSTPVELIPDINVPMLIVMTTYPAPRRRMWRIRSPRPSRAPPLRWKD